jgi:hemerythrin superfamily protein
MAIESQTRTSDVVGMLRDQHQTIRRLIAEIRHADAAHRAAAFEPLVRLLAVHETSEEEVVYPALDREGGEVREMVEDRKAEEDAAKKALAHLESLDATSVDFLAAFSSFADDVDDHASAEEATVFPALEALRDDEELRRMSTALVAAQALAPTHAHRSTPEGAALNVLVGPFVALVDRVRDAIRDAAAGTAR